MGILEEVFTGIQWWELVPDQSVFADKRSENENLNMAARSCCGNWVMAYLSSPGAVSINMSKVTAGDVESRSPRRDVVRAVWVDPRSGSQIEIGDYPNSGTQSFSVPDGWEDAVLLIRPAS